MEEDILDDILDEEAETEETVDTTDAEETNTEESTEVKESKPKKEDKLDPMEQVIMNYLIEFAKTDEPIKLALENPKKNIHDCKNYIMNQARKKLGGSVGYIEDATVYQWARHYYLEKIDPKELGAVGGGMATTPTVELTDEQKKEAEEKAKKRFEDEKLAKLRTAEEKAREKEERKRQKAEEKAKAEEERKKALNDSPFGGIFDDSMWG